MFGIRSTSTFTISPIFGKSVYRPITFQVPYLFFESQLSSENFVSIARGNSNFSDERDPIGFSSPTPNNDLYKRFLDNWNKSWGCKGAVSEMGYIIALENLLLGAGLSPDELKALAKRSFDESHSPRKKYKMLLMEFLSTMNISKPLKFDRLSMDSVSLSADLSSFDKRTSSFLKKFFNRLLKRAKESVFERGLSENNLSSVFEVLIEFIRLEKNNSIFELRKVDFILIFDWLVNAFISKSIYADDKPLLILSPVCPDYSYDLKDEKIVFNGKSVGDEVGYIGDKLITSGAKIIESLCKMISLPVSWIVGIAGFEVNLESAMKMNIGINEFSNRVQSTANKISEKLGIEVGIMPQMFGISDDEYVDICRKFERIVYPPELQRRRRSIGQNLGEFATGHESWLFVASIAKAMGALILDPASRSMGQFFYGNIPSIFVKNNYEGN